MLNRPPHPVRNISIALLVSLALAGVVTLVLLAFAYLFYSAESARRWEQLHQSLDTSADQLAVAVALPAWNFDESQITAIMKSGLNNRDLHGSVVAATANTRTYVLMRNSNGELDSKASPPSSGMLVETRPILVADQEIGSVTVYATTAHLLEELRQRRLAMLAVILVLDAALVLSVYVLLWFLMLKPLKAVGQYAQVLEDGHGGEIAVPQRTVFLGELNTLNESIRGMISLLDSRYRALMVSEERLSIATNAASIGIWDWDIVSGKLVWDEQMYRQYQIAPGQFDGMLADWSSAVLEPDRARVNEAMAAALRGEREYSAEFRIAWPDGTVRHIKADSRTFRDASGAPQRMVGVNYDISATKLAEQELLQHRHHLEELVAERTAALSVAVAEAQAANRAKSVFLATMSHELRTPLNSVIGFSRMMADSAGMTADEQRNLAIIHRSGQHLLTLINDILDLSKIEAGSVRLQHEVVDVNELMHEVMDMVSARAHQAGLPMALDCSGLPPAVMGDGAKLRQVLLNLVSNAIKFAGHGLVTLAVVGRPLGGARHALAFSVRDTGLGIALADQQRIFDPFVQADSNGPRDGTGLGLAISRQFVQLMGGALEVESAPGRGALFHFTIEAEAAAGLPAPPAAGQAALDAGQQGQRILVVDDNDDSRRLLCGLLAPLGFVLGEAADGDAALDAITGGRYDLVFMDWRMPGRDGLSVTRAVRANRALVQPRIVMLTASAYEEEKEQALQAGADEFLRKPLEQDQLFAVLAAQLGLQLKRSWPLPPAAPDTVTAAALAQLAPALRQALRQAVQNLDLAEVTALLAPARQLHPALVAGIEHLLLQHQYRQLCELIDTLDASARPAKL